MQCIQHHSDKSRYEFNSLESIKTTTTTTSKHTGFDRESHTSESPRRCLIVRLADSDEVAGVSAALADDLVASLGVVLGEEVLDPLEEILEGGTGRQRLGRKARGAVAG